MDDNKTSRERRLAAALRANLHRRKQQARERADSDTSGDFGDAGSEAPDPNGSGGEG